MKENNYIIKCQECGTKNRVPESRLKDNPVCGKCNAGLSTDFPDQPVILTDHTFEFEVTNAGGIVLVDCWAPWCGPCKSIGPIIEQLAKEYKGRAKICKLHTDENPVVSRKFNIMSIPTLLFFKDGRLINTINGAVPKSQIIMALDKIL